MTRSIIKRQDLAPPESLTQFRAAAGRLAVLGIANSALPFTLLSDPGGTVAKSWDVGGFIPGRSTFVFDKGGKQIYSKIGGITPPSGFPPGIWDELATQGKLRREGGGMYSLAAEL